MLASVLDDLALDPIKHLLQGEPRMSDAIVLPFVGFCALLVWAMRERGRRKKERKEIEKEQRQAREAWLDTEETCRYLGCGERFPRRQMRRVFTSPLIGGNWEWMCPRCFHSYGHQYRSEDP
jgi:hypothetical protein